MARAGFKRTVRWMRHRAARCAAPTRGWNPLRGAGGGTRPYEMGESSGSAVGADDLGGPLRGLCESRAHPHPPRMRSAPSPWKGEGLWAAQCAAPTKDGELSGLSVGAGPRPARGRTRCAPAAENGPGALAEKTQAQKRDRSKSRFCGLRAPVGPDGTAPKHS